MKMVLVIAEIFWVQLYIQIHTKCFSSFFFFHLILTKKKKKKHELTVISFFIDKA